MSHNLILFLIFLLPFYKYSFLTFEIFSIDVNLYCMFLFLTTLGGVFSILKSIKYNFSFTDISVILICFFFFVSFMLTQNRGASHLVFHSIIVPAISYFSFKMYVRSREIFHRAMRFYITSLLIVAVVAVLVVFRTGMRTIVMGINPIDLATLFFPAIVYYFVMKKWSNVVGMSQFVVLIAGFVTAFARGFTFLLVMAPIMRFLLNRGYSRLIMSWILLLSLLLVLLLAGSFSLLVVSPVERVAMQQNNEEGQSVERLTSSYYYRYTLLTRGAHFHEGLQKFLKKPVFGYGIEYGEKYATWHCAIIEMLVFGGILGYIVYTSFFYIIFARSKLIQIVKRESTVCLLVIVSVYLNSLMNGIMHGLAPLVIFIFAGMHEALIRIDTSKSI